MFKNFSTEALGFSAPQNEQIEMALTHGFRAVDVDIVDIAQQVQIRGSEKARRLLESARRCQPSFRVSTFRLPVNWEDDKRYQEEIKLLPPLAKLAADLGCVGATGRISPASNVRPMPENFEIHRQRLGEIGRILHDCGLRLGLEFQAPAALRQGKKYEFIHDWDGLLSLIDGLPGVALVIDNWQMYTCGASLDKVRNIDVRRVVNVRISDAPPDVAAANLAPEHRLLPATTGVVDSLALLTMLRDAGYQGPVTPAMHASHNRGRRRDAVARQAGELMDKLWRGLGFPSTRPAPAEVVGASRIEA
jgi:sugar phosphate isomerase/epimerase